MSRRKADTPLSVEIPPQGADRPAWGKVGVITAIGFIVGVAWPRLAGVRVGPSLPADATPAAQPSSAEPPPSSLPPASALTPSPSAVPAPSPAPSPLTVSVAHGTVVSCKTSDGDSLKGADCGSLPGLDGLVMPRLRKLSDCAHAAEASGKLHLTVRVDFGRESVGVEAGRGNTMAAADALVACAKTALADARPTGIAHDNQRYGVAYTLTFADEPAAPSATASAPREAADATAQVAWDVAIVRDAPKTGKIVARLDRGTSVRLGPPKEGWYPIKFGDGFASEGWVYRAAIAK